jgi:hypothetical protein
MDRLKRIATIVANSRIAIMHPNISLDPKDPFAGAVEEAILNVENELSTLKTQLKEATEPNDLPWTKNWSIGKPSTHSRRTDTWGVHQIKENIKYLEGQLRRLKSTEQRD